MFTRFILPLLVCAMSMTSQLLSDTPSMTIIIMAAWVAGIFSAIGIFHIKASRKDEEVEAPT